LQDAPLDNADTETPPRRDFGRFAGRCGRAVLGVCLVSSALVAALLLGLLVMLSRGPIETEAAVRAAEGALAELGGPGATAEVRAAGLDWSWAEGVSLSLGDVAVRRDTTLSLDVPRLVVRLRLLPLLVGKVKPRAIEIVDPHLVLDTADLRERSDVPPAPLPPQRPDAAPTTSGDTAVAPTQGRPASTVPVSTRLAEAVDVGLDRLLGVARDQGFQTVSLRGGRTEIAHVDTSGNRRDVRLADVEIDAVIDGPGGELDAGVSARGEVGRWNMRLTRTARDDGGHRLVFSAEDVTFADLLGAGGPAFALTTPFYPTLKLGYAADGHFDGADLDLHLGAGVFRFGRMPEDEILFDEADIGAVWNPRDRVFAVERATAAIGETRWNLHGRIAPPAATGGIWTFDLALDPGRLRPRDVAGAAVPIVGGRVVGSFDPATRFLDVTTGEVAFGATTMRSAGRLDLSGEEPRLLYDMQFSPLTTAEIAHAWPHWVAADARTWFVRNVTAGRVSDLRIRLDMPRFDRQETWPGNAVQMGARFDGLRFVPLGNLPPVTAAEGRFSVADRRFEATVDKGRAATKGREPTVEGLRFTVVDMFAKPARGSFTSKVTGDVAALAEIADAEPLAVLSQAGVAASGLSGTGTVTSQIDVTFEEPITAKSIDYRIEAQLDGFASLQPIQGRRFQDAKFKVVADPRGIDVSGRAVVDGVPADVHVFDAHGSKGGEKRDFKMEVDDAARQRMGIDLGGAVEGAIGLSVSQPDPAQNRSRVEADLSPARMTLAAVGWTKGPGVPAKATFDLWDDDKGRHLNNIVMESEGLSIRGNILLDKDHNVVSADFSRFQLRKGDNAKLKVTRGTDKVLTVTLDAVSVDVRGLLKTSRKSAGGDVAEGGPEIVLKLRAGAVTGFNEVVMSDVAVDGRWKGGAFQTIEARARTAASRKPLSLAIRPETGYRRFTVASEDAGSVLSFLDLFDRIQGGTLALSSRLGVPGTSEGTLRLVDFHLLAEPKAGRVASTEAADGTRRILLRRVDFDRSTNFDRAQVRFVMHDGIIDVTEGVAKGASVGATANGQIDVTGQRLSLSGTYIPAFGLNNLAGRIPIFGAITGSGSNEGLVGVTFRIVGQIEDPILQINPLSAVAPGIFRRIFEFQNEEMPQSSGDPSAPTRITPGSGPVKITP
jgi:hypothetical protein